MSVPDAHGIVIGSADDAAAIGGKRHAPDRIGMAGEDAEALAGVSVPDAHGIVRGSADDAAAIGRKRHARDRRGMAE